MVVNSHIQITQGILKGFAFKSQDGFKVHYLDLNGLRIKEEKIKILGSENFYFNESNEKYLSDIEGKFGEVAAKIKAFAKGKKENLFLTESDCRNIKMFFEYSFIRSEKNLKDINKYSVATKIIGSMTHDDLIDLTKLDKSVLSYFNEFKINIILNKTSRNFVVPRCVYYAFKKEKYSREMYVLPLNNKTGIIMIHKDDYHNFEDAQGTQYLSIKDEKSILNLNEIALNFEKNENNQFIVGELEELNRLKELIEKRVITCFFYKIIDNLKIPKNK